MGVEALVLGGDGALQHVLANLVESHRVAILQLELGEQRRAVRCVNHGWLRRVVSVGVLVVGQILQPGVAQRHHAEHARREKGDEHAQHRQNDDLLILYFRALTALHCARTHELTSISYRSGHFTNELWRVHKMEPPPGNAQRTRGFPFCPYRCRYKSSSVTENSSPDAFIFRKVAVERGFFENK